MLVIVAEKVEWSFADMLASRSSVRFANDMEGSAPKHCPGGRKLPDRCHRAKARNDRNQQATHSLGITAVLRYTHHAETPTRQVGFSLPDALLQSGSLASNPISSRRITFTRRSPCFTLKYGS